MATIATTANIGNYHGLKFSNDGKPRISFSAAETARIKDNTGSWVDGGTTWFNVTLFGGAAEALDQQIANQGGKGRVTFAGRMSTSVYEHNGQQRESLDVVADFVGLVPKNPTSNQSQPARTQSPASDPWTGAEQSQAPF